MNVEIASLRQAMEEYGEAVIHTVGVSMEPLLHAQESTVLVKKKDRPCRKNDVALYIRPNGQYVLHRVISTGDRLLMQGDYQVAGEWIDEECVVGLMVGFHSRRKSRFCPIRSGRYAAYLMCLPMIRLYRRARIFGGQTLNKWRRMSQ